jgi:hypothetical protein
VISCPTCPISGHDSHHQGTRGRRDKGLEEETGKRKKKRYGDRNQRQRRREERQELPFFFYLCYDSPDTFKRKEKEIKCVRRITKIKRK